MIRSLQLLIGEVGRKRERHAPAESEPIVRNNEQRGKLERRIAEATPDSATHPTDAGQHLSEVATALRSLGEVPVAELERMLAASIDSANHRIDPWFLTVPQRRLDDPRFAQTVQRRLGAYGWVDAPAPGHPGPTAAGLLRSPSASASLAAAVLRDRARRRPLGPGHHLPQRPGRRPARRTRPGWRAPGRSARP
ncbi:hypothetical protein ACTMTI_51395 [Nonomuraea sp. H19]|uniref:hypothetical protein n=1 Tax=Nonomuraea sp. H19 TaxID=3452206 RepID=UPI003F8CCEE5